MTPNQRAVRNIRIIAIVQIIAGLAIVGLFAFMYEKYHFTDKIIEVVMFWIVTIACVPAAFFSYYRFENAMKRIENKPIEEKLVAYRSAAIIRNLIVEAISLLFAISFFLTGYNMLQLEAILGAFIMVLFFPSDFRISRELRIDIHELEPPY